MVSWYKKQSLQFLSIDQNRPEFRRYHNKSWYLDHYYPHLSRQHKFQLIPVVQPGYQGSLVIAVVVEAGTAIIAALDDMQGNAGNDKAGTAWHKK